MRPRDWTRIVLPKRAVGISWIAPGVGVRAEEFASQHSHGCIENEPSAQVGEAAPFDRLLVLARELRGRGTAQRGEQDGRPQHPPAEAEDSGLHRWITRMERGDDPATWAMLKDCGCAPICVIEAR
jgi:hypothetical protein